MLTKIDRLKGLRQSISFDKGTKSELALTLEQAIKALDNPLGVLPGDSIEVWNGYVESCVKRKFIRYNRELTYTWITDQGTYKAAKLPVINIPVLTEEDVIFLRTIVEKPTIDEHDLSQLETILERKE